MLNTDCRATKEEAEPMIVKEKAKAKLKSGLGIARMSGSIMAGVDMEEKLEREAKKMFCFPMFSSQGG